MGTIGEIFNHSNLRGKLLSAAIGFPANRVKEVIDVLLRLNDSKSSGNFPGLFAFRFVKKTDAMLGFTKFPITCIVEMDGVFNKRSLAYCNTVWDELEKLKIPFTCHWGKQTKLTPQRIQKMYGAAIIKKWMKIRTSLMDADSLKVFTNPLMQTWGFV
jgi:hypothetical protein